MPFGSSFKHSNLVDNFIHGVLYPASKQRLLDYAITHQAPQAVLNLIEHLPEREYRNEADVNRELTIKAG